jgi:glyoxylase-like metal-dependent hydrolase (beta-lactamase superfamily II)
VKSTRILVGAAVIAGAGLLVSAHLQAQQDDREQGIEFVHPQKPAYEDGNIEVLHVQGNVYLVAGGKANITVQKDPDGLLLVDSGDRENAPKVVEAVKQISDQPIRQIINTSTIEHHTDGNEIINQAGRNIWAAVGGGANREPERPQGAPIIATERAMHRMAGLLGETARPGLWPQNTFVGLRKDWYWGGEPIDILAKPAAITDGDLIVWFRKSDVIAAGCLLDTINYPRIDLKRGGSVEGYLTAVNDILDIMIPAQNNQGGTLVVPGHGRLMNESDVAEIRDAMTIVVDRVREMIGQGMTLAQVKAARPSIDYDGIFGDPTAFIETVYTDLSRVRSANQRTAR